MSLGEILEAGQLLKQKVSTWVDYCLLPPLVLFLPAICVRESSHSVTHRMGCHFCSSHTQIDKNVLWCRQGEKAMHCVPCNYHAILSYVFLHTALRHSIQILHISMLLPLPHCSPPQLWQVEGDWRTHCFRWLQFSKETLCWSSEDEQRPEASGRVGCSPRLCVVWERMTASISGILGDPIDTWAPPSGGVPVDWLYLSTHPSV